MACLMKGGWKAVKKLNMNNDSISSVHCSSLILSKPVAEDFIAFLFIYIFWLADYNLINWTGILREINLAICD